MKFDISDRFVLLGILPNEGGLTALRVAQNIREAVGLTEAEFVEFGVTQEGSQILWESSKAKAVEIELTGPQIALVVAQLEKLNSDQKLRTEHLSLCEMFGIGKE